MSTRFSAESHKGKLDDITSKKQGFIRVQLVHIIEAGTISSYNRTFETFVNITSMHLCNIDAEVITDHVLNIPNAPIPYRMKVFSE